jgi:ribosomal 30S subunit maturation factor RimM
MIQRADFEEIGYLKKLIGTDGTFLLKLKVKQTSKWFLTEKEPIFIEIDGNLVPFFMDRIKQHETEPHIHFDTILSREKATDFLEMPCFYDKNQLTNADSTPEIENLSGYTLIDKSAGVEFKILNVNLIPGNPILEIEFKDSTIDIPLIPEAIISYDIEKQIIHTEYPEGLLQSLLDME